MEKRKQEPEEGNKRFTRAWVEKFLRSENYDFPHIEQELSPKLDLPLFILKFILKITSEFILGRKKKKKNFSPKLDLPLFMAIFVK